MSRIAIIATSRKNGPFCPISECINGKTVQEWEENTAIIFHFPPEVTNIFVINQEDFKRLEILAATRNLCLYERKSDLSVIESLINHM